MLLDAFLNPIPVSAPDPRHYPERACANHEDPKVFFPTRPSQAAVAVAAAICATCPVRDLCADFAAEAKEWGVWGGLYFEWGIPVVKKPVGRPRKTAPAVLADGEAA